MSENENRNYYIVKHDLPSLESYPNLIWRKTGVKPDVAPRGFNKVGLGDRWISFAYTTGYEPISQVTGIYECIEKARYGRLPYGSAKAWMIKGKHFEKQPKRPVSIPPLNDVLQREKKLFARTTFVKISAKEFQLLADTVFRRELDPKSIPLLQREPICEQELLGIVAFGYERLGIDKISSIQKYFPDMLVEIQGKELYLELEYFSSGFFKHKHHERVQNRMYATSGIPVAVLCWVDDEPRVRDEVHKVFELQSLLRDVKKITW
ncbi:MAG: hypothetical protein JXL20_01950 [Deltaproteobacteria bacterium]|nr:hypothetical protein [Deltaproteobacteria bacterium]